MTKASSRSKLCLLLTHGEYDEFRRALQEIHPLDKSFLLFEAVETGLSQQDKEIKPNRRACKIHFWLPKEIAQEAKQLAHVKATSQQNLIREFLFRYLANPPWRRSTGGTKAESSDRGEQAPTRIEKSSPESRTKVEPLTENERAEYERMKRELPEVLRRLGGYEPAVDDICIDQIARAVVYSRRIEIFLDSDTATEFTYSRVADSKLKLSKAIDNAMHELAVSRRDRMGKQTEVSLMNELKEAMVRALKTTKNLTRNDAAYF